MAEHGRRLASTPEEISMAVGLRRYYETTGMTQEAMAWRIPVERKAMHGWLHFGRVSERYRPAVRRMLAEEGIEIVAEEPWRHGPQVGLHALARATMLLRVSTGSPLNKTEQAVLDEVGVGVGIDENVMAAVALIARIGGGFPMAAREAALFRQAFQLPTAASQEVAGPER